MSTANVATPPIYRRRIGPGPARRAWSDGSSQQINGLFQLLLTFYIFATGQLPSLVQAVAFGVKGANGVEFTATMLTATALDILTIAPMFVLARNPLGVLHPLILAVVVWPVVGGAPEVIQTFGGWSGVLAGMPVERPYFVGLSASSSADVWLAMTKYNIIQAISLVCAYAGFWLYGSRRRVLHKAAFARNVNAIRWVMAGIFIFSVVILLAFVAYRGGLVHHLTSLGRGRFRELAGAGPVLAFMDIGAIAIYVWVAARPGDVKSPLFLGCLFVAIASQFISEGSRGSALVVPIFVGVIWSVRRQKIPWKIGLSLLPLMFAAIGLLLAVRSASWEGANAREAFSNTTWSQSLEIAQREIQERRAVSASIPVVARGMEVTDGPMYGSTYVAAVTAFVPRAIWEDKPRGAGSIYAQLFLGAPKEGTSIPVSQEAELYWNFGLFGVIFFGFIYGGLLRYVSDLLWRYYPDPFIVVFFVMFTRTFQISSKGLVDMQHEIVLLLLCYFAAALFVPKTANRTGPVARRPVRTLRRPGLANPA